MIIHLTASQIEAIHDNELAQSGGLPGTKDPGYLDLIAEKPLTELFGEEMYPGLFLKADVDDMDIHALSDWLEDTKKPLEAGYKSIDHYRRRQTDSAEK